MTTFAAKTAPNRLHVVFRVADSDYALPADQVVQMESFTGATRVPGSAPWIAGLMQVRGRVVPVIELRARFGLPTIQRTLDARAVIVQHHDREVGLLVDQAREVVAIAPDAIQQTPQALSVASNGFVKGVIQLGPRMLLVLDLARVLHEQENSDGE